jgi:hypothetical protein
MGTCQKNFCRFQALGLPVGKQACFGVLFKKRA